MTTTPSTLDSVTATINAANMAVVKANADITKATSASEAGKRKS